MKKPKTTVSIIGAGNWGGSLALALKQAQIPLLAVVGSGRRALLPTMLTADVIWLCVPDAAIASVSRRLVTRAATLDRTLKTKIVVHSSGVLSSQVLQAAADAGASIASVHPVMSFPSRRPVPLQGVSFGIETDPNSRRVLNALVRSMGGRPFSVKAEQKALYHAVGMLSSPLLVSHLVAAQQTAMLAGFTPAQARRLVEPIAQATLANVFSRGAHKSFSGPIARGDVETIRLHLQSLQAHPMLAAVYRSLALYALDTLPAAAAKEMRTLLRTPLQGQAPGA